VTYIILFRYITYTQNIKVQLKYSLEKGKLAVSKRPYKDQKQIKIPS